MSSNTPPPPRYIYKICPSHPPIPSPLPDALPVSDLDRSSGFMHMSTASQIAGTLERFFASPATERGEVYLLRVPYQPLEDAGKIRWESPNADVCGERLGEGMFPHIYDGGQFKLGNEEVESVRRLVSDDGTEGWKGTLTELESEGWLA